MRFMLDLIPGHRQISQELEVVSKASQARYDLEVEKDRLGDRIEREVPVLARASQEVVASIG